MRAVREGCNELSILLWSSAYSQQLHPMILQIQTLEGGIQELQSNQVGIHTRNSHPVQAISLNRHPKRLLNVRGDHSREQEFLAR